MIRDAFRAALVAACAFTAACGLTDLSEPDPGDAQIRFVNAAPGVASASVRWAGSEAFSDVAFGDAAAAGAYRTLRAGTQDLAVTAPSASGTGTTELTRGAITTARDRRYTLALVRQESGYTVAVLRDTAAVPAAGKAKVRVAHLSQLAEGNVDVYVTAPGADLGTATPTSAAITPLASSPYVELAAGTYQVRVTNAGAKTLLLDTGAIELAEGKVRTVFAMDTGADAPPLKVVVLDDL